MLTAIGGLQQIRPHYEGDNRELLRVLLNATCATEANLAIDMLSKTVPEKVLVTACNLREVLSALPSTPFTMRTDEETICRVENLERTMATMGKQLDDGTGLYITTAGNLVLDIIVRLDGEKLFWSPFPQVDDFVTPAVVDHAIESPCFLDAMIELTKSMGLVFNPKFYLSLEDWQLDHASDVFQGIGDLF